MLQGGQEKSPLERLMRQLVRAHCNVIHVLTTVLIRSVAWLGLLRSQNSEFHHMSASRLQKATQQELHRENHPAAGAVDLQKLASLT